MLNWQFYVSKGNQESDDGFVEHFSEQVETAIHVVLYAIQCLTERKQKEGKEEEKSLEEDGKSMNISYAHLKTNYMCIYVASVTECHRFLVN